MITIVGISPALPGSWAIKSFPDDPSSPHPPPTYRTRVVALAVVSNEEGKTAVQAMVGGDCGFLRLLDDENFEDWWHDGDSECHCGSLPHERSDDPYWCGVCWGAIAA